MKILLDECIDRPLAQNLVGHEVRVKGLHLHLVKSDNTSRDECEI